MQRGPAPSAQDTPVRVAVIGGGGLQTFAGLIATELRSMGHKSILIDSRWLIERKGKQLARLGSLGRETVERAAPRVNRALQRTIGSALRAHDPDLILTVHGRTGAAEVEEWRKAAPRALVALWYPDHHANLGNQRALVAGFDRMFVKDREMIDRLSVRGGVKELRYLPEAAPSGIPVEWNRPMTQQEERRYPGRVAVVGNLYPSRVRLLQTLPDDVKLAIYGRIETDGMPARVAESFTGQYVVGEAKHRVFRYSKAVLNNLHFAEVRGVNFRMFDAASAGGLIVTDDLPQVREFFTPGKEVLTYGSAEDLVDVLRRVTAEDRQRIGGAAQERVKREHTLRHRLALLLRDMGFGGAGE